MRVSARVKKDQALIKQALIEQVQLAMSVYEFGPFVLDTIERRLMRDGKRVPVGGKAWQILQMLAEARGKLVERGTFHEQLWPGSTVEERTLTVHISTLRRLLDDAPTSDGFIETVSGAGYRLSSPVRSRHAAVEPAETTPRVPGAIHVARWAVPPSQPRDQLPLASYRPRVAEAYFLQVQARALLNIVERKPTLKAHSLFEQAVALDPDYALAHAGLAATYLQMASSSILRPLPVTEATRLAHQSAQRAIELDETVAEAWTTLGKLKMTYEWDWQGAEADLDHAMALARDDVDTLVAYGRFLAATGQRAAALDVLGRARRLEPTRRETMEVYGQVCWHAGKIEQALAALAAAIALPPPEKRAYFRRMLVLDQVGRHDEAMVDRCIWLQISGGGASAIGMLRERERSDGWKSAMMEWLPVVERVNLWPEAAQQWMAVDEPERALDALERGLAERCINMPFLMVVPSFRPLHGAPRFTRIVQALGLDDLPQREPRAAE
jgi:DNA-binding winged helix-turn-helix (wHTH) protein/Tfp pilus assembly protein PilF